jgi:hypothetical protein
VVLKSVAVLSSAEADPLVREYEQSSMPRQMFTRVRVIPVHKRACYRPKRPRSVQTSTMPQLVPVERVEVSPSRSIARIELSSGCRIAVVAGLSSSLCISIAKCLPSLKMTTN